MFDWELELAPSKCVVMKIGCNDQPPVYSLNEVLLPVVKQFKDHLSLSMIILVSIYTLIQYDQKHIYLLIECVDALLLMTMYFFYKLI